MRGLGLFFVISVVMWWIEQLVGIEIEFGWSWTLLLLLGCVLLAPDQKGS